MKPVLILTSVFAGAILALPCSTHAQLELHDLFSDHAVFQRELPVPVWGTAAAAAEVTVSFAGQTLTTTAGDDGKWRVVLEALSASADAAAMKVVAGDQSLTVNDILVGEVWVCSGQSNMGMTVGRSLDADETKAAAEAGKFPQVRLFKAPVRGEDERQSRVDAKWTVSDGTTVPNFSAAGFFFGAALNRDLKVPVGLIQSANGGTNAYSWINRDTLENDLVAEPTRIYFEGLVAAYPEAMERYKKARAAWALKVKEAKAQGKTVAGRAPREPIGPNHVKRPAGHYNAMVAPLQPYAMRGALWYQGEANSRPPFADQYRDLMFALVEDWRADWNASTDLPRRDFPFYLVQLPNFAGGHTQGWPIIREQMFRFWKDGENTGMVTTIDVGEAEDIHPRDKKPVGERLARFARANTYGADIVYQGPIYQTMKVVEGAIVLGFGQVGGGLESKGDERLKYFEIAGVDRKFVPAEARIEGGTVVVRSDDVAEPAAVRYAWSNNPEAPNFFNVEGLPATPFRTDDWPLPLEVAPAE